jgi:hypothetical protein
VLGGAVTSGSATLQIFLEELLHPSRSSRQMPDVVGRCRLTYQTQAESARH